jgi:hypothetical protein
MENGELEKLEVTEKNVKKHLTIMSIKNHYISLELQVRMLGNEPDVVAGPLLSISRKFFSFNLARNFTFTNFCAICVLFDFH